MSWIITFNIIGDKFDPYKINVDFNKKNLPSEIDNSGRFKGKQFAYGSALFVVPKEIPRLMKFKC